MSTHFKHYKSGDIFGIIYTFDKAGEGIYMHSHKQNLLHNTVVLRGSILMYGPNGENSIVIRAGQIHDFDSSLPHEIAALEDDTTLINICLHGQPEGYDNLPPEELEGELEMVLTHTIDDFKNPIPIQS